MFPHRNIYQYTWISPDGKIHNQIDHILIYIYIYEMAFDYTRCMICQGADCDTDHYLVVAKANKYRRSLMGKDLIPRS